MHVPRLFTPLAILLIASGCARDVLDPGGARTSAAPAQASGVAVGEGIFAPPQVKPGQTFQLSFGLHNGGAAVTFEEIALAVLNPDGSHAYDAGTWPRVTVPGSGTWRGTRITAIQSNRPAGTYRTVVRGRMAGGNWFDFPAAGTGVNPRDLPVVTTGAFAAVIERIQVEPATVARGERPTVTAVIRNTSTVDTPWQGHATFRIRATVRRNGVLLHAQEWVGEPFGAGETRAGFAVSPTYPTNSNGTYDVAYEVWSGDDVHRFAVRNEPFWVVTPTVGPRCPAPPEARHQIGYTAFWRAPYHFRGATPWLAAVQVPGATESSRVDIDFIRLWARIDGVATLVSSNEYDAGVYGGELRLRDPWFGGAMEPMPATVINGLLRIRPSSKPAHVWHPYLHRLPRVNIAAADSVWMEMRVRVVGPALVQGGLDYWQALDGVSGDRLEEAAATDWICDTGAWQTLKLERSTEVRSRITLVTSPAGSAPRVGSPIVGTFKVQNFDNDTVRLAEIGIETRRIQGSNTGCDPWVEPHLHTFTPWATHVVLPPGGHLSPSATWVPHEAGRYCMTIVERRVGSPCNAQMDDCYQKTFFRRRQQVVEVAP